MGPRGLAGRARRRRGSVALRPTRRDGASQPAHPASNASHHGRRARRRRHGAARLRPVPALRVSRVSRSGALARPNLDRHRPLANGRPATMPACSDPARIRAVLNRDPIWALYLLGDLEPEFFARGAWWCGEHAVTLIYRGFDPPILAAAGGNADVRLLLDEMPRPAQLYLHVQPHIATLVRRHYRVPEQRIMLRMALAENDFRPVASGGARRLAAADASALLRLYGDGNVAGESPGFFAPEMIEQGVYYGIDQNDALVAVAGTHLVSDAESVAAIGNVYTRRDCRG